MVAVSLKNLLYEGLSAGQRTVVVTILYLLACTVAINHQSFGMQVAVCVFAGFIGCTLLANGKLLSALSMFL
eukprot:COSAG06_NODE_62318_length_265_cov_0.819277_1_plen_71_part_01